MTSISWQRKTEQQDLRCPARVCHRHPDAQVRRRCCVHHCGILPGAVAVLRRKDRTEFFGTGQAQKIGFKDYVDVISHNRAIQMLVVSASTDKLFMSTMSNSTVMICLFGIIFGNYAAFSSYSQITSIPIALISILLMNKIARQMGQKASMMTGTYGGIIGSILTGVFATRFITGEEGAEGALYGDWHQLWIQVAATLISIVFSAVMTYLLFKVTDRMIGIRVDKRVEEEGLDIYEHGESAYNR